MSTPANPIVAAVMPLIDEARERGQRMAEDLIEQVRLDLAAAGNDVQQFAPYPRSTQHRRKDYERMLMRYQLVRAITKPPAGFVAPVRHGAPEYREISGEACKHFIDQSRREAAEQYEAFVEKLVEKIGSCDSATLVGSHVWSSSLLTVRKGQRYEYWRTKQIVNVSKLGRLFNQWPTRKIKEPKDGGGELLQRMQLQQLQRGQE